jgi:hypothetical protein
VINKSPGDRVVLILDIRKPTPVLLDAVNPMAHGVMKAVYGRPVARKLAALTSPAPGPADRPIPAGSLRRATTHVEPQILQSHRTETTGRAGRARGAL